MEIKTSKCTRSSVILKRGIIQPCFTCSSHCLCAFWPLNVARWSLSFYSFSCMCVYVCGISCCFFSFFFFSFFFPLSICLFRLTAIVVKSKQRLLEWHSCCRHNIFISVPIIVRYIYLYVIKTMKTRKCMLKTRGSKFKLRR